MSDDKITRHGTGGVFALKDSLAETPRIEMKAFAGGNISIPSGSSITTLTFYGASDEDGLNFEALYDTDQSAVAVTVAANQNHPLPVATYGLMAMKIVVNTDGNVEISRKG